MVSVENPLTGPLAEEVPLRNAPLERVVAQVRFPPMLAVAKPEFTASFQDAIADAYPNSKQELVQRLEPRPSGLQLSDPAPIWRFVDASGFWTASLTLGFLALETRRYESRSDFIARFQRLLEALAQHVQPHVIERIGIRYIDRITGPAIDDIARLVRPEFSGFAGTPLSAHMKHAMSGALLELDHASVGVRWGLVPAGAAIDLEAIEPLDKASWVLDFDMFSAAHTPVDPAAVAERTRHFAERIYTVFRWAVTPEFLARYGGES